MNTKDNRANESQDTRAEHITHSAIRLEIPAIPSASTESEDGFFRMREWQQQCFDELQDSHHWIINAPMAAGKSFQICAMAASRLLKEPSLRVVITVPQTNIASGFRKNKITLLDSTRIDWDASIGRDLCSASKGSSTKQLRSFLNETKNDGLMNRVVLCTHATLVRVFATDPHAFNNVLVVIDEAHHIKHGPDEGVTFTLENQMGAFVKYALANSDRIRLGLTTATFYRGDAAPIVPDQSQFDRFDLAYDEYMATCKYLRSVSYDFIIEPTFINPLTRLFDRRIGKTIVYIPTVNSRYSLGSKDADVEAVIKAIAGINTPAIEDEDKPIMRVRRGDNWIRVVNLVDVKNREEKKIAIDDAHKNEDASDIDVLIALGIFKEGGNWRHADREIIIGQRNSLTEIIQTIGRLFRDVKGKEHVEVYQLLPFAFDLADTSDVRESLNDYLKAILLSMLLENVITPAIPAQERGKNGAPGDPKKRIDYLKEAFSDETVVASILSEITECVLDALATSSIDDVNDSLDEIVATILTEHGVHEYHDEITQQVLRMFNRRTVAVRGLNVGHINIDLVQQTPFDCLLHYGAELCGATTFTELRAACRARIHRSLQDARAFVRSLRFKTVDEWRQYCKSGEKPRDIPSAPYRVYKDEGWAGFSDWLGTDTPGTKPSHKRPLKDAMAYVSLLGFTSEQEWKDFCKSGNKPDDIPANPAYAYRKDGWTGIRDWLGVGTSKMRSFEEASAFARTLGLTSRRAWYVYCQSGEKPSDIPSNPHKTYKNSGWKGWGDWLGTGRKRRTPLKYDLAA